VTDWRVCELPNHSLKVVLAKGSKPGGLCAMTLLVSAGQMYDPPGRLGLASVLADVMGRGVRGGGARAYADSLDKIGVYRSVSAGRTRLSLSGCWLPEHTAKALPGLLDMVVHPTLSDESVERARLLAVQMARSSRDEPEQVLSDALSLRHGPEALSQPAAGIEADLAAISAQELRAFYRSHVVPEGAVLAMAGPIDPSQCMELIAQSVECWRGGSPVLPAMVPGPRGDQWISREGDHTYLGMLADAPDIRSPQARMSNLVAEVLGGGMSCRLNREAREDRGLCYAIEAEYSANEHVGVLGISANCRPSNTRKLIDCIESVLGRLAQGLDADELDRHRARLRFGLLSDRESTLGRADALAWEYAVWGRSWTSADRIAALDAISMDMVNSWLAEHAPKLVTRVGLGPTVRGCWPK